MILAGVLEAAHTSLALFELAGGPPPRLVLARSAFVPNDPYESPRPMLRRFVAEDLPRLQAACFILGGQPAAWPVDRAGLAAALGLESVAVLDGSPPGPPAVEDAYPRTPLWDAARHAARMAEDARTG